jgi:hypothetical protein
MCLALLNLLLMLFSGAKWPESAGVFFFCLCFGWVNQLSAFDVFLFVSSLVSVEDLGSFCMIAYAIWDNRNKFNFEGKSKPPDLVFLVLWLFWQNFRSLKGLLQLFSSSSVQISGGSDWLPPPPGRLKLNTAVAFRKNGMSVGIGAVIRDDKGLVVAARANQLPGFFF